MQSRASRAADGMSSVSSAWLEPNLLLICLARKEPNAFAANLGTVIKEHPPLHTRSEPPCMLIITGRRCGRNGSAQLTSHGCRWGRGYGLTNGSAPPEFPRSRKFHQNP